MMGWGRSHFRAYETDRSSVVAGVGVNYQLTKLGILGLTTMRKSALPSSIITSTLQ